MLSVVVRFVVHARHQTEFLERVVQQAADSRRHEPECRQFDVCVDSADPRRILLYESYTDEAAFRQHLLTPHFLAFEAKTAAWVEEKIVERWRRVEAR